MDALSAARIAALAALLALILGRVDGATAAVSFALEGNVVVGQGLKAIALADLDRDGYLDCLTVIDGSQPRIGVKLGRPGFGFADSPRLPTDPEPTAVAVGDLNNDGWPDVVAVSRATGMLHVFLNMGGGSFGPRRDFPSPGGPVAVAVADLNRDGRLDVVVTALTTAKVSLFLGDGQGGFAPRRDIAVGTRPLATAIADLNRDGIPDLAVVRNTDPGVVSVLLGLGDGTFGPRASVAVGRLPAAIAIGDVTGDGIPDLVTANRGHDTITVAAGTGDGTFLDVRNKFVGRAPAAVAIADFDGDGKNDVAVSLGDGQAVSVRSGNGVGVDDETFGPRVVVEVGSRPGTLAVADVDRDGRPDILVALPDQPGIRPLRNTTSLARADTLVSLGASSLSFSPGGVAVGDLDGDGRPEVVVTDLANGKVSIRQWSGSNSIFDEVASVTVGGAPVLPVVADLTRDGKPDILVLDRGTATFKVLRQKTDGTFETLPAVQAGALDVVLASAVADVDQDGIPDLVIAGRQGSVTFIVTMRGDGQGGFTALNGRIRVRCPPESADFDPCAFVGTLAIADVNRDGLPDVVAAISHPLDDSGFNYSNKVAVFLGEGGGRFGNDSAVDPIEYRLLDSFDGPGLRALAIADVNNDGALDIAAASDSGSLSLLLGGGTGYFEDPVTFPTVGGAGRLTPGGELGPGVIIAADVNRDGNVDLIVPGFSFFAGKASIGLHLGTGTGDFVPITGVFPEREFLSTGAPAIGIAAMDVDRDGGLDVIVVGEDAFNGPTIEVLRSRPSPDGGVTVFRFSRSGNPALYTVDESAGVAEIAVIRNVVTKTTASVQVTTTVCPVSANCTATADTDYTPVTTTLTFEPGVVSQVVRISIANDAVIEGDERLTVTLDPPNGLTAVLTIREARINGLIPSVSSVPGLFNLQVTGTGFSTGSRVLWNCTSLMCAGAAERVTQFSSTVRLDSDVNFADLGSADSARVIPIRVLNRTVGARLTNIFRLSAVKLRTLHEADDVEVPPTPGEPFRLEVTAPAGPNGVRFEKDVSTVSIDGVIRDVDSVQRLPSGCGEFNTPPCTTLIAPVTAAESRPGRFLVTVPRQFANGLVSDNNAQPSAAILVIKTQGAGSDDVAPKLKFVGTTGFQTDGVEPNTGAAGSTTFTFRVKYRDGDGNPSFTGFPKVEIRRPDGTKMAGSPFAMTYLGEDAQGWSLYEYRRTLPAGTFKYRFSAKDSTGRAAKGEPTTNDPTKLKSGPTSQ